jgi:hypothetical protein
MRKAFKDDNEKEGFVRALAKESAEKANKRGFFRMTSLIKYLSNPATQHKYRDRIRKELNLKNKDDWEYYFLYFIFYYILYFNIITDKRG